MSVKIKYHKLNLNKGSKEGKELVTKSINKFGMRDAVIIDKNGEIISGNHRKKAANNNGIVKERIIEAKKDEVIAIQYNDIDLSTQEGKELAMALNQTASKNIDLDFNLSVEELGIEIVEDWGLEQSKMAKNANFHNENKESHDNEDISTQELFPITVIASLEELDMFDKIKEILKQKSSLKTFSIILKEYYDTII